MRASVLIVLVSLASLCPSGTAQATGYDTGQTDQDVTASATAQPDGRPAGSVETQGVPCEWQWYQQSDPTAMAGASINVNGLITTRLGHEVCNGIVGPWQAVVIADDNYALVQLYAEAKRRVPNPMPTFSPPLTPWQYRNHPMQMWFANDQLTMPPLEAILPSGAGIILSPVVHNVSFDPGNGEPTINWETPKPLTSG